MNQVIALVDDDRNILTSVSIALQAEGFVTRVYSDGATALKAFADNPPDLGVFDIKMPAMDGMELLRRLREFSPMPVISGYSCNICVTHSRVYRFTNSDVSPLTKKSCCRLSMFT